MRPGMVLVVVRGPNTSIQGYGETTKGENLQTILRGFRGDLRRANVLRPSRAAT